MSSFLVLLPNCLLTVFMIYLTTLTVIMPMHTCLAVGVWPLVIKVLLGIYNALEYMPMAIVIVAISVAIYITVAMIVITPVTNCCSCGASQLPHIRNAPYREHLAPVQATDPEDTITMVTGSGRSFTRQIKTEDTAVQETNPATPGELVLGN